MYFIICVSDPKGPQTQGAAVGSGSSVLVARIPSGLLHHPHPQQWLVQSQQCCSPTCSWLPFSPASPQQPLSLPSSCGRELSFAHGGSQLDHCNDLSLRMASVTKRTQQWCPLTPCAISFGTEPGSAGTVTAHGKNNYHTL